MWFNYRLYQILTLNEDYKIATINIVNSLPVINTQRPFKLNKINDDRTNVESLDSNDPDKASYLLSSPEIEIPYVVKTLPILPVLLTLRNNTKIWY